MDIYCTRCAEPMDLGEFHDIADAEGITYDEAVAAFKRDGCVAVGYGPCERDGGLRAQAASVLGELMGDDHDGLASMLEDFEAVGMLDDERG